MKRKLKLDIKIEYLLYHYKNGKIIQGKNDKMSGDCSDLVGDCSNLSGNIDICEITEEEREQGIYIENLVE